MANRLSHACIHQKGSHTPVLIKPGAWDHLRKKCSCRKKCNKEQTQRHPEGLLYKGRRDHSAQGKIAPAVSWESKGNHLPSRLHCSFRRTRPLTAPCRCLLLWLLPPASSLSYPQCTSPGCLALIHIPVTSRLCVSYGTPLSCSDEEGQQSHLVLPG